MSDDIKQAAGGVEEGALVVLSELTNEQLLAYPADNEAITWKNTKYPVDRAEFEAMSLAADDADPQTLDALEDQAPDEDIDAIVAAVEHGDEIAEDFSDSAAPLPDATAPAKLRNFRGTPDTGWRPPDNTLGVGSNRVVTAVNVDLAGYTKSGSLSFRWPNMTTLFGSVTPSGASLFDPRVIYDHYARRWLIVVDAKRNSLHMGAKCASGWQHNHQQLG